MSGVFAYALVNLLGVFISAVSQVLLKKSALEQHESVAAEYLNPTIIFAYVLFIAATLLSTTSYKGIPLSMGPLLDAMGYLYVTAFSVLVFHERFNIQKLVALVLIIVGIVVYSVSL